MKKYVYMFPEGNGKMRELLGGKGANLAEMTGLGMPVPQGFTITTEACTRYYEDGKTIYPDIQEQILEYLDKLEKVTGKTILLENRVDPAVLGGVRVEVDGKRLDGTVKNRLDGLRRAIGGAVL